MDLKVLLQDIRTSEAQAVVVGCYEDVRPLKGLAGDLDWLLCGALSRLLVEGRFRGSLGETALITPRGKIPIQKLFMIGLGPRPEQSPETVRRFARTVAERLLGTGVERAALEYVAASGTDEGLSVRALHQGLEEGSSGRPLEVTLVVQDAPSYERISRLVRG